MENNIEVLIEKKRQQALNLRLPERLRFLTRKESNKIYNGPTFTHDEWLELNDNIHVQDSYGPKTYSIDVENMSISTADEGNLINNEEDYLYYYFDGLRHKINMQIKYKDKEEVLHVSFNNDTVYYESGGMIEVYFSDKWEDFVIKMTQNIDEATSSQEDKDRKSKEKDKFRQFNTIKNFLWKTWGIEI